ncbi:MAG: hypothetical protein KBF88_02650 [Polyangiaceae bacterium]|nr:hypothetical protein [Polyangiaceae bacterium]
MKTSRWVPSLLVLFLGGCTPLWGAGLAFRACSSLKHTPPSSGALPPTSPSITVPVASASASSVPEEGSDAELSDPKFPPEFEPIEGAENNFSKYGGAIDPKRENWFVPHNAIYAVRIAGHVLVHATSGVWVHRAKTLKRVGRIGGASAVALAADTMGKVFAIAAEAPGDQCITSLFDAVSFQPLAKMIADCPEGKMRFSEDGETLAIPSQIGNSTTVFSWRDGKRTRISNSTDVNDAMPFGLGRLLFTVDDANRARITNVVTRKVLFDSDTFNVDRGGVWGPHRVGWPPRRDLNAAAVSDERGVVIFGGEENYLWCYRFFTKQSGELGFKEEERVELDGNIEDIVTVTGGNTLVATDAGLVYEFGPTWNELFRAGSAGFNVLDDKIRIAPNGRSTLVVLNHRVFDWDRGTRDKPFGPPRSVYGMGLEPMFAHENAFFVDGNRLLRVRKLKRSVANADPEKVAEYTEEPSLLSFKGSFFVVAYHEGGCKIERLVGGELKPIKHSLQGRCITGSPSSSDTHAGIVDATGTLWQLDPMGQTRQVGFFPLPPEGLDPYARLSGDELVNRGSSSKLVKR